MDYAGNDACFPEARENGKRFVVGQRAKEMINGGSNEFRNTCYLSSSQHRQPKLSL